MNGEAAELADQIDSPPTPYRALRVLHQCVEFIESAEIVPLALLVLMFCFVGHKTVYQRRDLEQWGKRLAAVGFLFYALFEFVRSPPWDASSFLVLGARASIAGGLTLGTAWILIPVLAHVCVLRRADFQAPRRARRSRRLDFQQRLIVEQS